MTRGLFGDEMVEFQQVRYSGTSVVADRRVGGRGLKGPAKRGKMPQGSVRLLKRNQGQNQAMVWVPKSLSVSLLKDFVSSIGVDRMEQC